MSSKRIYPPEKAIHIPNLPNVVTKEDLKVAFATCGTIENVSICTRSKPLSHQSEYFAFINFKSIEAVRVALAVKEQSFRIGEQVIEYTSGQSKQHRSKSYHNGHHYDDREHKYKHNYNSTRNDGFDNQNNKYSNRSMWSHSHSHSFENYRESVKLFCLIDFQRNMIDCKLYVVCL